MANRIIILLLILPLSACDQASNFEDIEKSANQGDALSQALLGEAYVNAEGVSQDYKKAFEWYIKAAKQGNEAGNTIYGIRVLCITVSENSIYSFCKEPVPYL